MTAKLDPFKVLRTVQRLKNEQFHRYPLGEDPKEWVRVLAALDIAEEFMRNFVSEKHEYDKKRQEE